MRIDSIKIINEEGLLMEIYAALVKEKMSPDGGAPESIAYHLVGRAVCRSGCLPRKF